MKNGGIEVKKKSFIAVVVLLVSVLFANTSYAKSVTKKITAVFGSYIVKVNGKTQKTTTLKTGSTVYVPINVVSKMTGAKVKKSGSTYNISPVKKEDGITRKNIDNLKIKVNFMNYYNQLNNYYDGINLLCNFLDYSYYDIEDNNSVDELNSTIDKYNRNLKYLDDLQNNLVNLVKPSALKGYNTIKDEQVIGDILDNYNTSMYYISKALDDLKSYSETRDKSKISSYQKYSSKAFNTAIDAADQASENYYDYLSIIEKE